LGKCIETEKLKSVALPRLATGVGGLEWKDVKPLIEKHLGHLPIPVYVYTTFRSGVRAQDER
jgi:O-acetyl-ADP-ribose deacetylase (regulator of RNase III)